MNHLIRLYIVVLAIFLEKTCSTSDVEFEQDFVHSFLLKPDKLKKTDRLYNAEDTWIKKTGYKNAVGISIENWTNQKLEFPEVTIDEGEKDRWYGPIDIHRHSRDIAILAYSQRGSGTKGSLSYLVEDSWPRTYICLGWNVKDDGVEVVLSVSDKHLDYDGLVRKELNALLMKDKMRFFKGTSHYVVAVTCREEGAGTHLVLSVVPQNLDVWAWEKYYKQDAPNHQVSVQKIEEIIPTESTESEPKLEEEEGGGKPTIFERKDLLSRGESVHTWQGNKTERQVIAGVTESIACGLRIENWSKYALGDPRIIFTYGTESDILPMKVVSPGYIELVILVQKKTATGVSAVMRWNIGDTDSVLSLMVSVPYNQHLWSSWVAAGITKDNSVPDFNAMYSGTPDSAWFVRQKMGRRMEFSNGDLVLVVESDSGTSKPVVRLSVVPLKPGEVATIVRQRLEGKSPDRREGDSSILALSSSSTASQCHCPCMGQGANNYLCRIILAMAFILHIKNLTAVLNITFQ